jgi:hypothetical protein
MAAMDSATAYFLANRIWWAAALLAGPIAAAIAGEILAGIAVTSVLVLPAFVVFDRDRPWWPDEVKRLPQEPARTRAETKKLTLVSGIALVTGLAIALVRPWA